MCNCIEALRKEIMQDYEQDGTPAQYVKFDLSTIKDLSKSDSVYKTGQRIEIGYKQTDKKGVIKSKTEKTFISHAYCPWCGAKYNP